MRTILARSILLAVIAFGAAPAAAQAADLRVCADPDYMPFSNKAGDGFENKVAEYVAHALGEKLVYFWASTRGAGGYDQFVHETLDKKKCDVVMDVPYAADNILASEPYYVSSYVFIYPKKKHYDISSMDSPALKDLRIGFDEMLQALAAGKISVGVTWEPAVGYYLRTLPQYAVVAVPNSRSQGAPEQYAFPMSMAARLGDTATRDKLTRVIRAHKAQLTGILARNGVKLYQPADVASQ